MYHLGMAQHFLWDEISRALKRYHVAAAEYRHRVEFDGQPDDSPYCSRTLPRFLTYGFVQHLCGRPICTQAIFWLAWWESGRDAPVAEVLLLSGMIL